MTDLTCPMDAARAFLTALLPDQASRIEEASDAEVKASMDSAYDGGWTRWLTTYDDIKLIDE